MAYTYKNPKERFAASSKMVWTSIWAAIGLQLLALAIAGADAMPVLTVGVPALIAAAMAWSGITNWSEVKGLDAGYEPPAPDLSRQTVNVNPPATTEPDPPARARRGK